MEPLRIIRMQCSAIMVKVGESIRSQGQAITPVSLSTIKTTVRTSVNPILK